MKPDPGSSLSDTPSAAAPTGAALYALTRRGAEIAARLAAPLGATVYANEKASHRLDELSFSGDRQAFSSLPELLSQVFFTRRHHIFLCATGIAVRCIAPLLRGKDRDPAVLVIDQAGRHVISLLSGHIGGANEFARRVAAILDAQAIITTATDVEELPAIDCLAVKNGLRIGNLEALSFVSAALLNGDPVLLHDPGNFLGLAHGPWSGHFQLADCLEAPSAGGAEKSGGHADLPEAPPLPAAVFVSPCRPPEDGPARRRWLSLHPPLVCAGVGCKRGVKARQILDVLHKALRRGGYAAESLAHLASLDAKTDEPGLVEAAAALGLPLLFFSSRELAAFPVTSSSPMARERFGLDGVCEPAALAAAAWRGRSGRLVLPKMAENGVTVALALRDAL